MNVYVVILLCVIDLKIGSACNNHKLKLNYIKTCASDNSLKLKNVNITMDRNCFVAAKGTVFLTKPYKTVKLQYKIKKPPMPDISNEVDGCKLLADKKSKIGQLFTALGIKCPGNAKTLSIDGSKKIDISKYKHQIPMMAGNTDVTLNVETDNGKSCLEFGLQVYK